MVRVSCSARCVHNQGGNCGRKVNPGEAQVALDATGRCSAYRPG